MNSEFELHMTKSPQRPLNPLNLSPASLLSFLPWLALLGWLSSVAWFLTDDAFISFRYTRNLLEGHGLVFNPGEYVEGYTNFLWILELAAIWGIFDLRPEHVAPWLSVAYTIATIAAILWWVVRLPSLRNRGLVGWMALGLLCSSATFAVWTSGGGLETRQFTFFIVAAVVLLMVHGKKSWGLLAASLSLAAAALTRPEGLMLAACCFGWFAVQRLTTGQRNLFKLAREMIPLVTPFVVLVSAHFLFRYAYYGEWLPNTYYAKHVRPWYESGFRYLWAAALETGLYILLPLAFAALRTRWGMSKDGTYALALLCVVVHMAYLLPIGGDHFEYRPLDFYWPLLAVPAAEGIALLGFRISAGLRRFPRVPGSPAWGSTCTITLFLPILFYASSIQGVLLFEGAAPRQQDNKPPIELNHENAGWLLAAPGMPALVAISNDMRRLCSRNGVALRFPLHRDGANSFIRHWKPYEGSERPFIPDDALMVNDAIGRFYFIPDLKIVDYHGLADSTVARTPVTKGNDRRYIAHDRQATSEYLKQRGVNLRIFPPASSADAALNVADYAVKFGPDLWMPFNTFNAQWATARFADRELKARKTFSTSEPARNRFHVGGYTYVGERILAHFEHGFDGWQVAGEAVSNFNQHLNYTGQALIWGRADSDFLTSYHPSKGNRATGRARSPAFTATAEQFLAFLIAGDDVERVGLRLLADGEEAAAWRGVDPEMFELVVHPLAHVAGKSLQLELFDHSLGEQGHVMLDHVMLVSCDRCPTDEWSILAHALSRQSTETDTVYLVPGLSDKVDFNDFLHFYQGKAPIHMIRVDVPDLAQETQTALLGTRDATVVKVVQWNTVNDWIDDNIDSLAFLLAKYGHHLGSDEYEAFRILNYGNISHERLWTFYEQLEPLTINYDGGIALQGLALGQGAEQLSTEQLLDLGSERSLWGVLHWQIDPSLDVDYAISLRLYNADGELVYQWDDLLWDPTNHTTTKQWSADKPVDTLFQLEIPPALPAGEYKLRQVVYNFETRTPTVQQDVWQPEITLARLRLAEVQ